MSLETNVNINIYKSRIEIYPYIMGMSQVLERRLSILDYKTKMYTMRLFKIKDNKLYIPRGFILKDIIKILETDGIYVKDICDFSDFTNCKNVINLNMKPGIGPKTIHHKDSISYLVNSEDRYKQKFLNIDTGYGKTFCSIKSITILKRPTMIIVDKDGLIRQWISEFKKFTTIKDSDIYIIKGRSTLDKLYKSNKKYSIYLCATQTIDVLAKEDKLQEFVDYAGIGIKIFDEAHEMMKSLFNIDLSCNIDYNFYLTATPERSDSNERILYFRATEQFKRFGEYTTSLNKYIHVRNVIINTFPHKYITMLCRTKNGFSSIIYEKFIFKNERKKLYYFLICHYVVKKMLNSDKESKILIMLNTKNNINEISKMFNKVGIICGIYTSDLSADKKKKELNKNVILSTLKSSGSGLDIKNLRVIVNFVQFKSPVLLHQLFGRLRYIDKKALFFFNIVDEGFDDILRQNIQRQQFFYKKSNDIKNIKMTFEYLTNTFNKS